MAETINISKMAEKVSDEIFSVFKWRKSNGPTNANWDCKVKEHGNKTHPTDLVMYYDEPYANGKTYVQFDLKSFGKKSIKFEKVNIAMEALAKSLRCIELSLEWQKRYVNTDGNYGSVGLLFVYNHDTEYEGNFDEMVGKVLQKDLDIPSNSRIFVIGPRSVLQLHDIATDIKLMRADGNLPKHEDVWFFYPGLSRKVNLNPTSRDQAATLEMLVGPWITLRYENSINPKDRGILIYYRERANSKEEFLYLLDYMQHYQMFTLGGNITIKFTEYGPTTFSMFQNAIDHYVRERGGDKHLEQCLKSIQVSEVNRRLVRFSEENIGMEAR